MNSHWIFFVSVLLQQITYLQSWVKTLFKVKFLQFLHGCYPPALGKMDKHGQSSSPMLSIAKVITSILQVVLLGVAPMLKLDESTSVQVHENPESKVFVFPIGFRRAVLNKTTFWTSSWAFTFKSIILLVGGVGFMFHEPMNFSFESGIHGIQVLGQTANLSPPKG